MPDPKTKAGSAWYERAAEREGDHEVAAGGSGRQQLVAQGPKPISPDTK